MSILFSPAAEQTASALITLAFAEDLNEIGDLTCQALIDPQQLGTVQITARQTGVLAGLPVAKMVLDYWETTGCQETAGCKNNDSNQLIQWEPLCNDGDQLQPGDIVARISGPLNTLLISERTVLNFLTHLSGIATLTQKFVDEIAGTAAQILDTRKTTPAYRSLEKYAVAVGGGTNHRIGLYDGILIKDNHLAACAERSKPLSVTAAIEQAHQSLEKMVGNKTAGKPLATKPLVEVEVDTLEQFAAALPAAPDIVLLDNMNCETLCAAVALRNRTAPNVQLEATGGVTFKTVRAIAETGIDRISIGALTHSAPALDLAFDWSAP